MDPPDLHATNAPRIMPGLENDYFGDISNIDSRQKERKAKFADQAEILAHLRRGDESGHNGSTQAVQANFVTSLDPAIEVANGARPLAVPANNGTKLNQLRKAVEDDSDSSIVVVGDNSLYRNDEAENNMPGTEGARTDATLDRIVSNSTTNPLFPPLPAYGPPSLFRDIQSLFFRITSAVLSLAFLMVISAGTLVHNVPRMLWYVGLRASLQDPRKQRPFYWEEVKRKEERKAAEKAWSVQESRNGTNKALDENLETVPQDGKFVPTEGGPDPLVVDVGYYARRVGLDCEIYQVQTEDGFIIDLCHVYNPREYQKPSEQSYRMHGPKLFTTKEDSPPFGHAQRGFREGNKKYPVLMMHGLLQSSGAFICNDDDSLAFYLAKSGYDVWLGNNRCGFNPKHTLLEYGDPRMWAWNIRQMGIFDLPALVNKVLAESGFPRLALIAHSQGTTQTFVALAKEQRPEIGGKISVFCALAPAVYAGPLIGKIYFKIMQLIGPSLFRLIFGIHSFIPLMMKAHQILPARPYSWLGYYVFSYLFNWSDTRWERDLRNRMFQWAPVYVSAESMRWWLGRECFAKQKCILATRDEGQLEDKEDEEDDDVIRKLYIDREPHVTERRKLQRNVTSFHSFHERRLAERSLDKSRGRFAWYDEQFPPLALWVAGSDDLVDGRRLLRRFDRGREPHVRIVHKKIIEGYEHLDVIWAMDAIEKVGKEVREVIWRTADAKSAARCRTPVGCELALEHEPSKNDVPMIRSGGRVRMASISEGLPTVYDQGERNGKLSNGTDTKLDATQEQRGEHDHLEEEEEKYDLDDTSSDQS